MKVIRLDQRALKMLGIISSEGKPYYWRVAISRFVCLTTPIVFLLPSIAYFISHFSDVAEATSAFYLICIAGMASMTYSEYWIKRPVILSIIQRIQALVNDTPTKFRPSYEKTESFAYKIVHYFKVFVFCSVFGVVSLPLLKFILVWTFGNDPEDVRILPAALQLAHYHETSHLELYFLTLNKLPLQIAIDC